MQGVMSETHRAPVCGMAVPSNTPHRLVRDTETILFCSPSCLQKFSESPSRCCGSNGGRASDPHRNDEGREFTCPMHPDVLQTGPGTCPICGMALEPVDATAEDDEELRTMRRAFWVGAAFTLPLFVLSMSPLIPGRPLDSLLSPSSNRWLQLALAIPVLFWSGRPILRRGWESVQRRRLNMFSLIGMGV